MSDLFTALALMIVLEGLLYAAFPEQMKRALILMLEVPNSRLRVGALSIAAIGMVLLFLIKG